MTALSVPMECAACGTRWEAGPKPDGTMPAGTRCPKDQGGCGKVRKIPRSAIAAMRPAGGAAGGWDPPSEPREISQTGEPCPRCDELTVYAEPRGTIHVCVGCGTRVTPAGVLAPYERGTAVTRAAKSQRERDLEALDLAERKGVMLSQLRDLAADDTLHPGSAMKVEWFADEVKTAASATRLDELAELFKDAGIRRRRFWQARPALAAGDDEDGYDDEEEEDAPGGVVVLATPASIAAQQHRAQPHRMTWAEALAVYGWRVTPSHGGCQIIDEHGNHCGAMTGAPPIVDAAGRHAWLCLEHYGTLGGLINDTNRSRGVA